MDNSKPNLITKTGGILSYNKITALIPEPSLGKLLWEVQKDFKDNNALTFNPLERLNLKQLRHLLSKLRRIKTTNDDSIESWMEDNSKLEILLDKIRSNKFEFGYATRIQKVTNGKIREIFIYKTKDKIIQKLISLVLNVLYDWEFLDESIAYRPKKNIKQGMEKLYSRDNIQTYTDSAIKIDIQKCFNSINSEDILQILEQRIKNVAFLKVIKKSLTTYYKVDGKKTKFLGLPQGSIHAPVLSNIFLHYNFDIPLKKSYPCVSFSRYADDIIIHLKEENDVTTINQWLEQTLNKSNLTISQKTPNVLIDMKMGFNHLGYRIDMLEGNFRVNINKSRILNKVRESIDKNYQLQPYLYSQYSSSFLNRETLLTWKEITLTTLKWLKQSKTPSDDARKILSETSANHLLREILHQLEQINQGVTT
jgi:retron-type reverse transcriptase